jgi:hypothetical protein
MTSNFFSPLSFVAVFGSGIRDPGSGMGKNQNPGYGINIPDPPLCLRGSYTHTSTANPITTAGLEKTRVFKKKTSPVGFLGFFGFYWVFLGFFAQTKGFLGFFSVSRILLGASRL